MAARRGVVWLRAQTEKAPIEIEKSAGNLKIPLANGNVMNIPLSAINITEEVNKTGIWKHVNDNQNHEKLKKKSPKGKNRFKKKKQVKKEEKVKDELQEKRLSTCKEEDDEGIIIKVTDNILHI